SQFRRRLLQRRLDRADDAGQRLLQRFQDLVAVEREAAGYALRQIAALDLDLVHLVAREGGADLVLDPFGGRFADQDAVVAADIVDDRLVEAVAADPHRCGIDDAVQGQHGHLRRAAADVQHHGAARLVHRHVGADRGRHRFLDQVHLAGAGADGGFLDGAALDLGRAAGHADQYPRAGLEEARLVHLLDEVLQHLLGDGEVGDDAVLQRPDGLDVAGRTAKHGLGFGADRSDALRAAITVLPDGNNRGLVEDDSLAPAVNQRVGGTEINGKVVGKKPADAIEHYWIPESGEAVI